MEKIENRVCIIITGCKVGLKEIRMNGRSLVLVVPFLLALFLPEVASAQPGWGRDFRSGFHQGFESDFRGRQFDMDRNFIRDGHMFRDFDRDDFVHFDRDRDFIHDGHRFRDFDRDDFGRRFDPHGFGMRRW